MNRIFKLIALALFLFLGGLFLVGCQKTAVPAAALPGSESQASLPAGTHYIRSQDGMTQLFVPSASFLMGAEVNDPGAGESEKPAHPVVLGSYWLDETEVNFQQYGLCVESGRCAASKYAENELYNSENFPVVGVDWWNAQDYCTWVGGRLPTEAEWEYAAKGVGNLIYPWGNDYDPHLLNACDLNCAESWADPAVDDGYQLSAPVGSFPGGSSWVGALDMAGNVWEWVWDWCGEYQEISQQDPLGPEAGRCKIIRGGAWASPPEGVRTTYRIINSSEINPDIRHPNIGFRCVIP